MTYKPYPHKLLLALIVLVAVPLARSQQSAQTGSGTITGDNSNPSSGTRNSTGRNSGINTGSNGTSQSGSGLSAPSGALRTSPLLFIAGSVALDDGSSPPVGAVIERVCPGSTVKEAYVSSNGSFGFQVGASSGVIGDASDGGLGQLGNPRAPSFGRTSGTILNPSLALIGCELRAQLAGYRSSSILLGERQTMGTMDVGTILLYPIEKVPGTLVSVTDLSAPKEAKKAVAKAEKAIQRKNLDEGEKDLERATTLSPKYATAWFLLGQVFEQSHRVDEARNAFAKALDADRNYVRPYVALALLAARESKWQETADLTDRALLLDPIDLVEGYYLNSVANYQLHELDAAERSARKLERLDSMHRLPQVFLVMADIFHLRRDFADEAEQLRDYLKFAAKAANADQVRSRLQSLENFNP